MIIDVMTVLNLTNFSLHFLFPIHSVWVVFSKLVCYSVVPPYNTVEFNFQIIIEKSFDRIYLLRAGLVSTCRLFGIDNCIIDFIFGNLIQFAVAQLSNDLMPNKITIMKKQINGIDVSALVFLGCRFVCVVYFLDRQIDWGKIGQ